MSVLDTLRIFNDLKASLSPAAAEKIAEIFGAVYDELHEAVTKADLKDFSEARERTETDMQEIREIHRQTELIIKELAEAQKRTETRVEELAEAQKRTEARVEELAEAQKRTETRVEELVEAQKRIEGEVQELREAQIRTEAVVKELAEAQKRTERVVAGLAREMKDVKKQLGGLAMAVGYGLEDKILPHLARYAEKEFGMKVSRVDRRNIEYSETAFDEVNLYAEGEIGGGRAFLIGECKAQPGKKDADRFARMAERLAKVLPGRIISLLVGYSFPPEVERYIRAAHPEMKTVKSYEFEMTAGNSRR